ncbi:hypothetical protein K4K52_002610 [Colletotrichum sp. SAR 10_76]|nr:hypothetical protein K4K52_002610 [Colletotrichum sp. SAR 10_76]
MCASLSISGLNAGFDCHRSSHSDTQDAVVPKHNEVPIRRNPSPLNPLALNEREGRAYRFFQIIGAPALSSGFECEFWGRLVLQLANADDAIFHATVALGLLLEDMHNWPISWPVPRQAPPTERTANALRHYQTALQQLFVPVVGKESANAISLASAVVFACIEVAASSCPYADLLCDVGIQAQEEPQYTFYAVPVVEMANWKGCLPRGSWSASWKLKKMG